MMDIVVTVYNNVKDVIILKPYSLLRRLLSSGLPASSFFLVSPKTWRTTLVNVWQRERERDEQTPMTKSST